jgi:hypothetical protein
MTAAMLGRGKTLKPATLAVGVVTAGEAVKLAEFVGAISQAAREAMSVLTLGLISMRCAHSKPSPIRVVNAATNRPA